MWVHTEATLLAVPSCQPQTVVLIFNNMTTTEEQATQFDVFGHELDLDQLADIAKHGMAGGVCGFIYSSELADTFDSNEDEIWNYLDEYAFDLGEGSGIQMVINSIERSGSEFETMQQVKEQAVWMAVELFAYQLCCRNNHPDFV